MAKVRLMENQYREVLLNQMTQFEAAASDNPKNLDRVKNQIVEKQIHSMRNYAYQIQQARVRLNAISQANELALATQKLRSEIARRKKTEEELRQSEERFHSLFSNMSEGVALHEMVFENGNPVNYRLVDVNPIYEQILGKTRQQTIGMLATDVYQTSKPPYLKEFSDVVVNRVPFFFETYYEKMEKHFAISVAPWQERGFATIFSDITDRKLSEDVIQKKNQMLEKMNGEKDKFFSIIAHDLKNPFTSIMGLGEMLGNKIQAKDYNNIEKFAQLISLSTRQVYDLLINLMEWSKTQTGRMAFNPQRVEIRGLISEAILLNMEAANQKSINISSKVDSPVQVTVDRAMIATVLRNLISNAIKFTKPGGEIIISAQLNHTQAEISVEDSGIGMTSEKMSQLFRIDKNNSTPGTQNEKGTGLGLILCKEFVEKHNGKIWVESYLEDKISGKPGGSIFSFSIPIKRES